jgi:hypothetical protein
MIRRHHMAVMVEIEFLEEHTGKLSTGVKHKRCEDYVEAEMFSITWQRWSPKCTVVDLAMREVA